jgi:lipoate-protein ligase A
MAVDEALLRSQAREGGLPVLRLYTWHPPAISLGYFQKARDFDRHVLDRLGILVVRRITGGRAVLHAGDVTYSVVARAGTHTPQGVREAYHYLNRGLCTALRLLGAEAERGETSPRVARSEACFALAAAGDLVHRGAKFAGSAQARMGDALLQHGSIAVRCQRALLEAVFPCRADEGLDWSRAVTSLDRVLGGPVPMDRLQAALVRGFAEAMGVELVPSRLSPAERELAQALVRDASPLVE